MQPNNQPQQIQPQMQPQVQNQQSVGTQTQPLPPATKKGFPKTVIILVLVLILVGVGTGIFSFLSGGSDTSEEGSLTWWGNWEDTSVVLSIIEEYKQDHPNLEIVYEYQDPEDYRERLANSLAQGKGPDILRIHNTWIPMFSNNLSVLPSEVMGVEEYEQTFYRAALDSTATKDGIKGIPLMIDGLVLFINQDLFTTFGVPTPETWSELREAARDLTLFEGRDLRTISQSGVALGVIENVDNWEEILALMMIQNGASLTEPSDENTLDALRYFSEFKTKEFLWDETLPSSVTAFATRKAAMIIAPASASFEIRRINPSMKFKTVPVPQLRKFNESEPDITYASFWVEGVNKKSKNSNAAWEFLKYMSSRETLQKLQSNQKNSSRINKEASPRLDMRDQELLDANYSGFIKIAPTARVWYMASNTNDGETGLNTQLSNLFEVLLTDKRGLERDISEFGLSVRGLLAQYGLATPPPPPEK